MVTMDVSMVVRWKATGRSSEVHTTLVQVEKRKFVIKIRRGLVISHVGGGVGGARGGGSSGSRPFVPGGRGARTGSPHNPLGGSGSGMSPTFMPGGMDPSYLPGGPSTRRSMKKSRPPEDPPVFVGGGLPPPPPPPPRRGFGPGSEPPESPGSSIGGGSGGGNKGNGGSGKGKSLGSSGGNGEGGNGSNGGRGYDQYGEVFRSLNPVAGVLGVSFAFLGGTALYNAGSSILGGPITTANALQKPPDIPKSSVAAISDPFGEEMMPVTEIVPTKVPEWGLLQFNKKRLAKDNAKEERQVEDAKPFFRCRDVIEIFDAISGKSTTSLMLGFGEVASLAINLPLDASRGRLVMGPHEVVLNAQTDMVDMKYDFTARSALIDLKVVNDEKFDVKLGFKSGRQWPNIESVYKMGGISIADNTELRSTIVPDQRSMVVAVVAKKALLNGKVNSEVEANSNREVKGTATVISPFWGWNLQVSANASLAGATLNNVDAVLNKSFMV